MRKVTSACDDRHLLPMAVNDRTASSWHLAARWSTATGIPGAIFQQDNARPHFEKTVRDFCSTQHMQLLPWPVYLPDMSPIEHVWDLVGRRFSRDPRPAASKDELLLRIQALEDPSVTSQTLIQGLYALRTVCTVTIVGALLHTVAWRHVTEGYTQQQN
ncbi:hypothetical protein TNCV_4653471 [Trichonephila clavipes]|nr:hypothetical protein TNCV_4653471 [Trichonephila clavipes]